MLITVEKNRLGHLEIDPVNSRTKRKLIRDVLTDHNPDECLLYIQEDYNVDNFIDCSVPKRQRASLNNGWPVKIRVSDDFFGYV